jgi:cutinase
MKDNGEAVQGASAAQTLVICDKADNICAHGDLILPAHLLYSQNAAQAASFVTTKAGLALGSSKYANSTTL